MCIEERGEVLVSDGEVFIWKLMKDIDSILFTRFSSSRGCEWKSLPEEKLSCMSSVPMEERHGYSGFLSEEEAEEFKKEDGKDNVIGTVVKKYRIPFGAKYQIGRIPDGKFDYSYIGAGMRAVVAQALVPAY